MASGPPTGHSSSSPFCIRFGYHFRSHTLIDTLQHSILGARLTLTHAGITPASQTDLANPSVHRIVIWGQSFPKGSETFSTLSLLKDGAKGSESSKGTSETSNEFSIKFCVSTIVSPVFEAMSSNSTVLFVES